MPKDNAPTTPFTLNDPFDPAGIWAAPAAAHAAAEAAEAAAEQATENAILGAGWDAEVVRPPVGPGGLSEQELDRLDMAAAEHFFGDGVAIDDPISASATARFASLAAEAAARDAVAAAAWKAEPVTADGPAVADMLVDAWRPQVTANPNVIHAFLGIDDPVSEDADAMFAELAAEARLQATIAAIPVDGLAESELAALAAFDRAMSRGANPEDALAAAIAAAEGVAAGLDGPPSEPSEQLAEADGDGDGDSREEQADADGVFSGGFTSAVEGGDSSALLGGEAADGIGAAGGAFGDGAFGFGFGFSPIQSLVPVRRVADSRDDGRDDDLVVTVSEDDILVGSSGDDTISGGDGDDTIFGGTGDDTLNGDAGNDTLNGDAGIDSLYGGSGDDNIFGFTGDDVLQGGQGTDSLSGGDGADEFQFGGGSGSTALDNAAQLAADVISDYDATENDFFGISDVDFGFGSSGTLTAGTNYFETATASIGSTPLDASSGVVGSAIVSIGAATGTGGVDLYYTDDASAMTSDNSYQIADIISANTSDLEAADFFLRS